MGLDMYFKKGKRIPGKSIEEIEAIEDKIYFGDNKELLEEYKDYITEIKYGNSKFTDYVLLKEVGYLRKANAIHNWFVCNIQNGNDDCRTYEVNKKQLEKLKATCRIVLNNLVLVKVKRINCYDFKKYKEVEIIFDSTVAKKLLPTKDGFFFGDVEYDRNYVEKLKEIVEQLEKILEDTDFDREYIVYTSSW